VPTPALETAPKAAAEPAAAAPRPNQSVRCGLRVLRALHDLGPYEEHQVSEVAVAAELRTSHVSRLLSAAVEEGVAERGNRHGSYSLTRHGRALFDAQTQTPVHPRIREVLTALHFELGLATAYHQCGWRPGTGFHLDLVDAVCPPDPDLHRAIAWQAEDLRHSATGRAALSSLPPGMATGADGRPLELPIVIRETITKTLIATSRTATGQALATGVVRSGIAVGTLTVLGPRASFENPLQVQEYAVLLRRAAHRCAAPV
jgi:DNA-binding IclR family transcriptional regulator